jgi:hypothetical protein
LSTALSLQRVLSALAASEIPHMVAGSFAGMAHGLLRTTYDIDVIIDPTRAQLDRFVASLPADEFYVSPEAADEAWRRRGQFNVIDLATGWKTDLILIKRRAFSREEFSRRRPDSLFGVEIYVATAEDTILSKLDHWARELGVTELWARVQREAAAG